MGRWHTRNSHLLAKTQTRKRTVCTYTHVHEHTHSHTQAHTHTGMERQWKMHKKRLNFFHCVRGLTFGNQLVLACLSAQLGLAFRICMHFSLSYVAFPTTAAAVIGPAATGNGNRNGTGSGSDTATGNGNYCLHCTRVAFTNPHWLHISSAKHRIRGSLRRRCTHLRHGKLAAIVYLQLFFTRFSN